MSDPADIPLQAASNLRDFGGAPARNGTVARGRLFRAPALVRLTPSDSAVVAALGLATVIDLRGVRERAHMPTDLDPGITVSLPIEPTVGAGLRDILRTGQTDGDVSPSHLMALLRQAYVAYALGATSQLRAIFSLLGDPARYPLLIHCSAGKDRTGFVSALILTLLGVARDDVLADYLATNRFWRREVASHFALPRALADVLLGAHAELLDAAFDAIDREHGDLDAYAERALGLDATARRELDAALLV